MIDLLTLVLFNSLYICGLYNSVYYELDVDKKPINKEILWWGRWYTRNLPNMLRKPLTECIICMASIHSFPFWIFNDFNYLNLGIFILYIFALSGLNALIYETVINK